MRIHDDLDILGRQPGGPAKQKDSAADIGHALANPKQASVQTMLEVQRLAGNAGVSELLQREEDPTAQRSPVLDVIGKGGGRPLDAPLRQEMEGRLGANFSDVKVHTDPQASESARAVQATAYTVGNEIVVRNDRWSPDSSQGKETIAHELTHVIQQRAGPVAGTAQGDGVSISDPSDQFEQAAESTAKSAMSRPVAPVPAAGAGASAQLHADEELQRQAAYVQRQAEEDEAPEEDTESTPPLQTQRQAEEDEAAEEDTEGAPPLQMQREGEDEVEEEPG